MGGDIRYSQILFPEYFPEKYHVSRPRVEKSENRANCPNPHPNLRVEGGR